jgi:hypothetical protein
VGTASSAGSCFVDGEPRVEQGGCGCNPVACQSYYDWWHRGEGGEAAWQCSVACQARCAGDSDYEVAAVAAARALGEECRYLPDWCPR